MANPILTVFLGSCQPRTQTNDALLAKCMLCRKYAQDEHKCLDKIFISAVILTVANGGLTKIATL